MRVKLLTNYYQQFDADYGREVPAEGYGGWRRAELELDLGRSALVVMHAWDARSFEEYPGWWRAVEYQPRAKAIAQAVFPRLLTAVRRSELRLVHVVGGGDYYRNLPGYQRVAELAKPEPPAPEPIEPGDVHRRLTEFRSRNVTIGEVNRPDVQRAFAHLDFDPHARPAEGEPIAENSHQLYVWCRETGVDHLIYCGFAVNWCLLLSPGGMADMSRRGLLCSVIRQATTAVENRETARTEAAKALALWRVALAFGFVYDLDDFLAALSGGER